MEGRCVLTKEHPEQAYHWSGLSPTKAVSIRQDLDHVDPFVR